MRQCQLCSTLWHKPRGRRQPGRQEAGVLHINQKWNTKLDSTKLLSLAQKLNHSPIKISQVTGNNCGTGRQAGRKSDMETDRQLDGQSWQAAVAALRAIKNCTCQIEIETRHRERVREREGKVDRSFQFHLMSELCTVWSAPQKANGKRKMRGKNHKMKYERKQEQTNGSRRMKKPSARGCYTEPNAAHSVLSV